MADAAVARARLQEASDAILAGVTRMLPTWVEQRIAFIADAWGRLDPPTRAALDAGAVDAAAALLSICGSIRGAQAPGRPAARSASAGSASSPVTNGPNSA